LAWFLRCAASEFYNETLLLFSLIEDELTPEKFPSMTAGPKFEYLWQDGVEYKHPTKLPARSYIQNLLTWVETQLNSQAVFPTDPGRKFPDDFEAVVQRIFRRLFRVYAHIYFHHWESIRAMGADAHLNTCFKQFIFFVKCFSLVPDDELAPLAELIASFVADQAKARTAAAATAAASSSSGSGVAAASASSASS
jgi:MOB kinase activator 1